MTGVLKGTRLDEVAGLTLAGVSFKPGGLMSTNGVDELGLSAPDVQSLAKLRPGQTVTAKVALKDGRTSSLKTQVLPPRPGAILIAKSVQYGANAAPSAIQLTDPNELPQNAQLTFSVRAQGATTFSDRDSIEVATADGSATTTLTPSSGLMIADAHVALATLDPAKAFGSSVFGPLRFRLAAADGGNGDWQPLATLVRLPVIHEVKCPPQADRSCELNGANLFLLTALSGQANFAHPVQVPEGFTGVSLPAPRPAGGNLYLKLHDDPDAINLIAVPDAARQPRTTTARSGKTD
jgi:hypothetical protein